MCWSLFLIKLQALLQHRCFPVKFAKFLRMSAWNQPLKILLWSVKDLDQEIHCKLSNIVFQIITPRLWAHSSINLLWTWVGLSYLSKFSLFWKNTIIGFRSSIIQHLSVTRFSVTRNTQIFCNTQRSNKTCFRFHFATLKDGMINPKFKRKIFKRNFLFSRTVWRNSF